ncbi:MAG: succinate dehydrogenase assembly factor 2 [Methylotenera sp.]|nr:succinate dehydrogenase assembly factor 2 [Methylotenera sp.]
MLNAEILREAEQKRLAWRCRRGMLELDIVLQRFIAHEFNTLNLAELQAFDAMLDLPDNQFWHMLNTTAPLQPIEYSAVVVEKLKTARLNYQET